MMKITEQARELRALKQAAAEAKSAAEDAKDAFEDAQRKFYERLQDEGIGSIKVDGTLFVPQQTTYHQIQDREAFIAWAEENEEELLEPKERKSLLNELVKDYIERGEELPPGLGFYVKDYISQRIAS